jgi:hypothetical protein
VEADAPFGCTPQLKQPTQTSNKTKSNIKHNFVIDVPTAVANNVLDHSFYIAPNPVKDELLLHFNTALTSEVEVVITDVLGKPMLQKNIQEGLHFAIPLHHFASGLYFVQVINGKQTSVKKFVKE